MKYKENTNAIKKKKFLKFKKQQQQSKTKSFTYRWFVSV